VVSFFLVKKGNIKTPTIRKKTGLSRKNFTTLSEEKDIGTGALELGD
jgi:hypothetical protein